MQELIPMMEKPSRIKNTGSQISNTYTIKLWEDIVDPHEYAEEIDLINSATEYDTIFLDICSAGGYADTAMLFNRALRATQANTVAIVGPTCASAAGVIALSCDDFILDETSSLMIHTSSYGYSGKDTDVYEHANFARVQLKVFYEQVFGGFLSAEELTDVIKGQPYYFSAKEIEERLGQMSEYRQQQYEQQGENEEDFEPSMSLQDMIEQSVEKVVKKYFDKPVVVKQVKPVMDDLESHGWNGEA